MPQLAWVVFAPLLSMLDVIPHHRIARFCAVLAIVLAASLPLVMAPPPAHADGVGSVLNDGQVLQEGQSLTSPSGQYSAVLQDDGNFVVYGPGNRPLWADHVTNAFGTNSIVLQDDGNLVAYLWNGYPLWATGTSGGPGAFLVMQDDGNLVLYDASSKPMWASGTGQPATPPPSPSPTPVAPSAVANPLTTGQVLQENQYLASESDLAILQGDGNFVVYASGRPLWATGTNNSLGLLHLVDQADGNLVLYTSDNRAVWASGTYESAPTSLLMQSDGNLVLYAGSAPLWSSMSGKLPLRVDVYGDSLAVQGQPSMDWVLPFAAPGVQITTGEYPGTAICDFIPQMLSDAQQVHPEVVEIAFSGNPYSCAASAAAQGEAALVAKYVADLNQAIAELEGVGVPHIVVIGAPTLNQSSTYSIVATSTQIRTALQGVVASLNDPRVTYVPGGTWIDDPSTDAFTTYRACTAFELFIGVCTGPVINGVPTNVVRSADGVHFCNGSSNGFTCDGWASGAWRYGSTFAFAVEDLYRLPHAGPVPT